MLHRFGEDKRSGNRCCIRGSEEAGEHTNIMDWILTRQKISKISKHITMLFGVSHTNNVQLYTEMSPHWQKIRNMVIYQNLLVLFHQDLCSHASLPSCFKFSYEVELIWRKTFHPFPGGMAMGEVNVLILTLPVYYVFQLWGQRINRLYFWTVPEIWEREVCFFISSKHLHSSFTCWGVGSD